MHVPRVGRAVHHAHHLVGEMPANGGHWDIRDLEHHVPSPHWLIDPKTGIVVASGELPEGGGMIPDATFEPRVLICSTVPPLIAR